MGIKAPDASELPAFTTEPQNISEEVRRYSCVILGNIGSGKSSAARSAFVEPLLELKRRSCIIDPTGVWWGLRFKPDGSPGFRIAIVGGLYGDQQLTDEDGDRLARHVADSDDSIIIDVSEMGMGERHRFCEDFYREIYARNRKPLHLIVDEADESAPQNPLPETKRMLHHFDRIVRRGRTRGFRPLMITQRPAVLHKNVLTQANVMIAMRLPAAQDRDAVLLWIKGQGNVEAGKEVLNTISRLQLGEGWVWAPGAGILNRGRFTMFKTFDSMKTPKDDEPAVDPPGPFPYDFPELEFLADRDDDDAEDEAPAGKTPKDFEQQLRAAEERGRQRGFKQGYDVSASTISGHVSGIIGAGNRFMDELKQISEALAIAQPSDARPPISITMENSLTDNSPQNRAHITQVLRSIDGGQSKKAKQATRFATPDALPPAGDKLLQALAHYSRPISWREACVAAVMSHGNGYFYGGAKYLREHGLVDVEGEMVAISTKGRKLFDHIDAKPYTLRQLVEGWSDKLRSPAPDMLAALTAKPDKPMTVEQLSAAIGKAPGNGHWYGGVASLLKNSLIEKRSEGFVLSEFLRSAPRK